MESGLIRKIGIVSPGEMGTALGLRLAAAGHPILVTVAGRRSRTADRCREAGFEPLAALDEVVRQADVVVSCVPPLQALEVARSVAAAVAGTSRAGRLYVDLNSISPQTVREVESIVTGPGWEFADATIHGTARRLGDLAVFYASGPASKRAVQLFETVMRAEDLGGETGRASAFKMLLGGVSKTMAATMLEIGSTAEHLEVLPAFLRACREFYPGWMEALDRFLPSYAQHAGRRSDEVAEIETFMTSAGMQPRVIAATRELLRALANSAACESNAPAVDSIAAFVSRVQEAGVCDAGQTTGTSGVHVVPQD